MIKNKMTVVRDTAGQQADAAGLTKDDPIDLAQRINDNISSPATALLVTHKRKSYDDETFIKSIFEAKKSQTSARYRNSNSGY
ncbi:hypothetical protein MMC07_002541 [Pseudocyphellaria aurata]|nr:hypothetical protein [Pseudocyphellaria aurata]